MTVRPGDVDDDARPPGRSGRARRRRSGRPPRPLTGRPGEPRSRHRAPTRSAGSLLPWLSASLTLDGRVPAGARRPGGPQRPGPAGGPRSARRLRARCQPAAEEPDVRGEHQLDGLGLPGDVRDAGQQEQLMVASRAGQRPRQRQRVPRVHVVVGQAVHQQQRPAEPGGVREQRAAVVGFRVLAGVTQVPLGGHAVVPAPLADRRARDGRREHVGPAQHGQGGQVPAERPAADPDAAGVELARVLRDDMLQGGDLVLQGGARHVEPERALPGGPAARRAAAVRDDHREALVGEPLRLVEQPPGPQHLLGRPAVGGHHDGQRPVRPHVVAGEDDRGPQFPLARGQQRDAGRERRLGKRGDGGDLLPVALTPAP